MNDDFADGALVPAELPQTLLADLSEATLEPLEPTQRVDVSVWFRWRAPHSGWYGVSFSEIDEVTTGTLVLQVFEGSGLDHLRDVGFYSFGSAIFPAEPGRDYHLRIAGEPEMGRVPVKLESALFRENHDTFDDRADLGNASPLTLIFDPRAGTPETSRLPEGLAHKNTVWWEWTPHQERVVRLTSSKNLGMAVYEGEVLEELIAVETVYGNRFAYFRAQPGTVYAIAAYSLDASRVDSASPRDAASIRLEAFPPVTNDNFTEATDLGSLREVDQHAMFSSAEEGEPGLNSPHGNLDLDLQHTLWWRWEAPEAGLYGFETVGYSRSQKVHVYRGSDLHNLRSAATAENPKKSYVQAEAGESFYIQGVSKGSKLRIRFRLEKLASGSNQHDHFANAVDLGGDLAVRAIGFNGFATEEGGEPPAEVSVSSEHPWLGAANSLWWQWTAPRDGLFRINTTGTDFAEYVRVFRGQEVDSLEVAHLESGLLFFEDTIAAPFERQPRRFAYFMGEAGVRYHICVQGSQQGMSGLIRFTVESLPLAENDRIETVKDLPSTETAITDPVSMLANTWWRWTAPRSGLLKVSVPAHRPIRYRLYRGAVEDDVRPPFGKVERGVTYLLHLSVDEFTAYFRSRNSSNFDPFVLRLDLTGQPANDDFENAIDLGQRDYFSLEFDNRYATAEPGEPDHGGTPASHSVWWRWKAPRDGWISLDGSIARVGVYTGDRVDRLDVVDLASFNQYDRMFFARATTDYVIAADSGDSRRRWIMLAYTQTPNANDFFSNRFDLGSDLPVSSVLFSERGALEPEEGEHRWASDDSFWWSWKASGPGRVALEVQSATYFSGRPEGEIFVAVYTGKFLGELVPVAESGGDPVAAVAFEAIPGTEYAISVRTRARVRERIQLDLMTEGETVATESILVEDPFRDWIARFPDLPEGQRGPEGRPTSDGIPNLVKYAVGLNPLEPHRYDQHLLEVIAREDHVALRYELIDEVLFYPPYQAIIEWSVDGIDWRPVPEENHLERIDFPIARFGTPPEASLFGSRLQRRLPLAKDNPMLFRLSIKRW